ncbi:alpha/beta hydrolase [Streptomyces sp. WAC 06738]|uniref:alpha/beta fold hydrolase n=1 Tax=Streptomyces sp. WAC 06738 TaxID=2203210 RepID=UPI000F6DAB39|nr:alpha/beta fold hydrolase [Streptomyces sp. WAC 06738]AZM48498.1 alpha/beta hydrolase [Streptomyces sp. WAC 06738]
MSKPPFVALPGGVEALRVETPRGAFAALRAGRPVHGTALLLPGFTGSKEDFIALLEPLAAAGFRVVAVDGRGQYETEGPGDEDAYTQDELAQDVLALATALGTADGPPPHLLGHSHGGHVARAAVLRAPGACSSLTLMSSGPGVVCDEQRSRAKLLGDALATYDMETVWQAMRAFDPPEAADARTPADVNDFLHRRWLGTSPAQLRATARQLCEEPDRTPELAALPLPVHVLTGTSDYVWPVAQMDDMAKRLRAHRTVVDGADHSPNVDRPAETAAALAAFWSADR